MAASVVKKIYDIREIPISTVKSFFDNLGCSLITTSSSGESLTILVDNTASLRFNRSTSSTSYSLYAFDDNHNTMSYCSFNIWTRPFTFLACYSDTFFYFQYNDAYNRRLIFVYEIVDNKRYFGATGTTDSTQGAGWYPITSVSLKQAENQEIYVHTKLLNYIAPSNLIDYSVDFLYEKNNASSNIPDTNTVTCTTVTQDNVITFGAHNYYSLGPNTLIQLNDN